MTPFINFVRASIQTPVLADAVIGIVILLTLVGIYKLLTFGKFFE